MTWRGTSTVVIHKNGTVSYYSTARRAMVVSSPELIDPGDLRSLSTNDYQRLKAKFGRKHSGGFWRLRAVGEAK